MNTPNQAALDIHPKITLEEVIGYSSICIESSKLTCPLCEQMLFAPTMCSNCNTIFCRNCVFSYVMRFKCCPRQCTSFELVPPPEKLVSFEILCKGCENVYPITTFFQHYKRCIQSSSSVPCWNCNTTVPIKMLKFLTYKDYAHLYKYNNPVNIEDDKPFIIKLTTNDTHINWYVTCNNSYLRCDKNKAAASIFSEVFVDNKSYIKVYNEDNWKFLKGSYQMGVILSSWKECSSISIDRESKSMVCNEGLKVAGRKLVIRKEEGKLFFYVPNEHYLDCCVNIIYI